MYMLLGFGNPVMEINELVEYLHNNGIDRKDYIISTRGIEHNDGTILAIPVITVRPENIPHSNTLYLG